MSFKVGDTVECIKAWTSADHLKHGQEYIVESYHIKNGLILRGVKGAWSPARFKLSKKSFINRILNEI